ncbi:MAG: putative metallopeptidase [Candidatus Nanoarchaeia archaeon]|nr:putative metallopeptidase [Candidatus Nanoarchaeia archaeon]
MLRFFPAPEIKVQMKNIIDKLGMGYIKPDNVVVFKSEGSTSNAIARCWELPRIWQEALTIEPHYVIEFCSERYNNLSEEEKEKVIIHELLHIPKTFSGALRPHKGYVNERIVSKLHKAFKDSV